MNTDNQASSSNVKKISGQSFTDERSFFKEKNLRVEACTFDVGESPFKEAADVSLTNCIIKGRYPLWYCKNATVDGSSFFETSRAGMWYTNNLVLTNCALSAPKTIRRCEQVTLDHVTFTNAVETLWACNKVVLKDVTAKGEYFAMNSENMFIENFTLDGKYSFDGVKNVEMHNSKLITKDAFWNSENVTVYDSFISAEYLGWNSKNLTFVNCTIESLQGMCYIDGLTLKNCRLLNTTLAFEYSTVDADIKGKIDSVLNPTSGTIKADEIGILYMTKDAKNKDSVKIICDSEYTVSEESPL